MSLTVSWGEIALRLALSVLAGAALGFNREGRERPAGLRTTVLVSLAACLAMLQANLLLPTAGKPPDSFVTFDVMRLPLGILSGMGFIGGGAILHRSHLVIGVTTAATLWIATVIGLCFGGGQLALGVAGAALGLVVLLAMKWLEGRIVHDRSATLLLAARADAVAPNELRAGLRAAGIRVVGATVAYASGGMEREDRFDLRVRSRERQTTPPAFLLEIAHRPGVHKVQWTG